VCEGMSLADFEMLFDEPMAAISTFIRACMVASPGKVLYVADYSSIEARVLGWLAGQTDLLEKFFLKVDVYVDAASEIYQVDPGTITKKQRALGKVRELGCGFGMGKDRFAETCESWGVEATRELTDRAVDTYREAYPAIVEFWSDMEEGAKKAINHPNTAITVGKIKMASNGRFLFVKLPSGRTITYPMPKVVRKKKNFPRTEIHERLDIETGEIVQVKVKVDNWIEMDVITYMGINSMTKQWSRLDTWGGSLVENVVQGVARDIMAHAQIRTQDAGFEFLFSVHDELVSERTEEGLLDDYIKVMSEVPKWAAGLPIAAEGYVGRRFKK
jgi:DNA polymerase